MKFYPLKVANFRICEFDSPMYKKKLNKNIPYTIAIEMINQQVNPIEDYFLNIDHNGKLLQPNFHQRCDGFS